MYGKVLLYIIYRTTENGQRKRRVVRKGTNATTVGSVSTGERIFPLDIGPNPSLRAALRPVSHC